MNEPHFISRSAVKMIGMAIETSPGSAEISALWQRFIRSNASYARAEAGVNYGIMQMNQSSGVMRYMAGEATNQALDLDSELSLWDIPATEYAVFEANLQNVSQVFHQIYSQWLPSSSFQRGRGPDLERYGKDFSPDNPNFEILIPIQTL